MGEFETLLFENTLFLRAETLWHDPQAVPDALFVYIMAGDLHTEIPRQYSLMVYLQSCSYHWHALYTHMYLFELFIASSVLFGWGGGNDF